MEGKLVIIGLFSLEKYASPGKCKVKESVKFIGRSIYLIVWGDQIGVAHTQHKIKSYNFRTNYEPREILHTYDIEGANPSSKLFYEKTAEIYLLTFLVKQYAKRSVLNLFA